MLHRCRRQRGIAILTMLAMVWAFAGNATPAYADPGGADAPQAATPLPLPPDAMRPAVARSLSKPVAGAPIVLGKPKPGQAVRMVEGSQTDYLVCTPYISWQSVPGAGVDLVTVSYLGELVCNFYLAASGMVTLIDRGASGGTLSTGAPFYFGYGYYGYSYDSTYIDGRVANHGRNVEVAFDLNMQTLNGVTWGGCYPLPGLRYLSPCYGLGTTNLVVTIGSDVFWTGMASFNPARVISSDGRITLLNSHVGGQPDPSSTAYANIAYASVGYPAYTSWFGHAAGAAVYLDQNMLLAMVKLAVWHGYTFRVTAIAGGEHSANSAHYRGRAFDVDVISGTEVNAANPFVPDFKRICAAYGATQVLGPGDAGHGTHLHCAW